MRFLLIALLISSFSMVSAQTGKRKLKAYLNEKQFYTPEGGNYLEIQLQFAGHTVNYVSIDSLIQGEVEITQLISNEDSIVVADKYRIKTPHVTDSIVDDFYDVRKYGLTPGSYVYELILTDVNNSKDAVSVKKNIVIEDLSKDLSCSDITLAEVIRPTGESNLFSKAGYDVIPFLVNYYPTELTRLPYYVEIYNSDKFLNDSVYVVQQKIFDVTGKVDVPEFNRYFRILKTSPLQPIAKVIDISFLPAGSYILEVNVLDRNKNIVASNIIDFDRNNDEIQTQLSYEDELIDPAFTASVSDDSLDYYVASLIPISSPAEVKNILKILKEKNSEKNRKYLQTYWKSTNALKAYENWMKYKLQVQLVERLYSNNFQAGFETDRGRVYLQYGTPSSILERPTSPTEFPYEIWQYDKIGIQSNKRFVFYNPDLVNNAYQLLHSDVRGELQNYRWQYYLNKRTAAGNNIDDPTGGQGETQGSNAGRLFNNY